MSRFLTRCVLTSLLFVSTVPAHAAPATPSAEVTATQTMYVEHPGSDVTRAAFVASLMRTYYPGASSGCLLRLSPSAYNLLFRDVSRDAPYAPELCAAMERGIVHGYADGNFRPDRIINGAETAKVVAKTFGLAHDASDPQTPWYRPFTDALGQMNIDLHPSATMQPATAEHIVWTVQCNTRWMKDSPQNLSGATLPAKRAF